MLSDGLGSSPAARSPLGRSERVLQGEKKTTLTELFLTWALAVALVHGSRDQRNRMLRTVLPVFIRSSELF